jgi:hypothetical protein
MAGNRVTTSSASPIVASELALAKEAAAQHHYGALSLVNPADRPAERDTFRCPAANRYPRLPPVAR